MTLKEYLLDWRDRDVAAYCLGITLGIFPVSSGDFWEGFREYKHIFWCNGHTGDLLDKILMELWQIDILEWNDDKEAFRWKGKQDD